MSLLLKSELRLRLGARHCDAEIWRAGLLARCVARASAQEDAVDLIGSVLQALEERDEDLPSRAVVLPDDELLFFATLPADGPLKQALPAARAWFSEALGDQDVLVGATLSSNGRRWLASALPMELVEQWRGALSERDIELHRVQPALLQDLRTVDQQITFRQGLIALVRSEGISFIDVEDGGVGNILWERCDTSDTQVVEQRVRTQLERHPGADANGGLVVLVPPQAAQWRGLAEETGWHLTQPPQSTL